MPVFYNGLECGNMFLQEGFSCYFNGVPCGKNILPFLEEDLQVYKFKFYHMMIFRQFDKVKNTHAENFKIATFCIV